MGTRILAVEDDERIREALMLALEDEGWTVEGVSSGEAAIEAFERQSADVVLIDIMLPGIDGFELCRTIRRHSDVPIVMVTARNDTHDIVAGLEAGADDYVTKPFGARELVARLQAALRRAGGGSDAPTITVDGLEVDLSARTVRVDGSEVHLTPIEFDLLRTLARNRGRLLTHRSLLVEVWGPQYASDTQILRTHIANLRRKIEPPGEGPRYIRTDPGVGYRLAT